MSALPLRLRVRNNLALLEKEKRELRRRRIPAPEWTAIG